MPATCFVTSSDGTRIAYDEQGEGPALILVHGFTNNRQDWHRLGWVENFQKYFRVITLDMRGRGESDIPTDPAAYRIERLIEDILAVAGSSQAREFSLMAHSWGGSVGLHLVARSEQVKRAVIAGTSFGPIFTDESIDEYRDFLQNLQRLKTENRLEEVDQPTRAFAKKTDLPVLLASNEGLRGWPGVEPQELRCPTLIYAGVVADKIAEALRQRQPAIEAAGVQLKLFEGLDHSQEVTALTQVWPAVITFLT
jgi:pimeloyl-ACP methyl ester carboxylesterase